MLKQFVVYMLDGAEVIIRAVTSFQHQESRDYLFLDEKGNPIASFNYHHCRGYSVCSRNPQMPGTMRVAESVRHRRRPSVKPKPKKGRKK